MKISIRLNWTLQMLTAKTGLSQVRCPEGVDGAFGAEGGRCDHGNRHYPGIGLARDFRGIAFFWLEEAGQR